MYSTAAASRRAIARPPHRRRQGEVQYRAIQNHTALYRITRLHRSVRRDFEYFATVPHR
jgi:hypothetical protein